MNIESKCILILGWVTFSITVRIVVLLVLSETKPMMQGGGVIEQLGELRTNIDNLRHCLLCSVYDCRSDLEGSPTLFL